MIEVQRVGVAAAFVMMLLGLLVSSEVRVARAEATTPTALPVVFVPGISGTRLADKDNVEYWTAAGYSGHDLLTLYPSQLHPTLYPTNAITEATFLGVHISYADWQTYGPILDYFGEQGFVQYNTYQNPSYQTSAGCDLTQASNNPNLFVFAYDWRISNAANAALLADYIKCVQKFYPNTKVNLVAHSMGGLVARRYIISNPGTHPVNALISVGSPWLGASKLVWVEETGQFIFFVWASAIFDIIGSFNGASELMNSQAWYDIGGKPALVENGQDLNGNGNYYEKFTYPMLVDYMDAKKGKDGFLPGTQNQTFHSYVNSGNQQDDWRTDTTGVKYFHIVGAGLLPDTTNQVVAGSLWKCIENYSICDLSTWMYPKFTRGDGTVPLLSSSRQGDTLDYNAPNATVYTCQAFGANNRNVDHIGMLSNPVVQGLLTGYLAQANGGAVVDPPASLICGNGQAALGEKAVQAKFHKLVLHGATEIKILDESLNEFYGSVRHYDGGELGSVITLATGEPFKVQFRTTDQPLYLEWTYRNEDGVRQAVRFRDLALEPNTLVELTIGDNKFSKLRFDSNGDGLMDTRAKPTVNLKGNAARDVRPPKVKFSTQQHGSTTTGMLSGDDNLTGVQALVYSFDKVNFRVYSAPFVIDAGVTTVYAFGDDAAGNRSKLYEFSVE